MKSGIKLHLAMSTTPEEAVSEAMMLANKLDWPVTFYWTVNSNDDVYYTVHPHRGYEDELNKFKEMLGFLCQPKAAPVVKAPDAPSDEEHAVKIANSFGLAGAADGIAMNAAWKGITKGRELERATVVGKGRAAASVAYGMGKHTSAEALRLFVEMIENGE